MSSYNWSDRFFYEADENTRALIMNHMNNHIEWISKNYRDFAIFRFGLLGNPMHSRIETAMKFCIPLSRVRALESSVLRQMCLKMPTYRSPKHL